MEEFVFLLALAAQMTGLPPLPAGREPTVVPVSETELRDIVCADGGPGCMGLQASFDADGNRILIQEYGAQRGVEWESFLLHEYVHALQHARWGEAIYATCEARRRSEAQAYAVQDAYLRAHRALLRVGRQMVWWHCDETLAAVTPQAQPLAPAPAQ